MNAVVALLAVDQIYVPPPPKMVSLPIPPRTRSRPPGELVIIVIIRTAIGIDDVIAGTAVDQIVTTASAEPIVARIAQQEIVAPVAADIVIAIAADQGVVAAVAVNVVVESTAGDIFESRAGEELESEVDIALEAAAIDRLLAGAAEIDIDRSAEITEVQTIMGIVGKWIEITGFDHPVVPQAEAREDEGIVAELDRTSGRRRYRR